MPLFEERRLVRVLYTAPRLIAGWQPIAEVSKNIELGTLEAVGFVVAETEDVLMISSQFTPNNLGVYDARLIPQNSILDIEDIDGN